MAKEKEKDLFVVSDRRRFTDEGETRPDVHEEPPQAESAPQPSAVSKPEPLAQESTSARVEHAPSPSEHVADGPQEMPTPPTEQEQHAQHGDYKDANRKIDAMLGTAGAQRPPDFELTFERLIGSLYMQA